MERELAFVQLAERDAVGGGGTHDMVGVDVVLVVMAVGCRYRCLSMREPPCQTLHHPGALLIPARTPPPHSAAPPKTPIIGTTTFSAMSFRKRNLVINRGAPAAAVAPTPVLPRAPPPPGVRPSPINGQPTTSTGTPSLDALLAGHAGLPLGCSLLVEEPGTTDFGGALLRYYAAEGIVQGHAVTVVGFGEAWARDLPAVTGDHPEEGRKSGAERMKIAWRYEKLGEFGSGIGGSRGESSSKRGGGGE